MTGKAILEINYKMSRFLTMRLMDIRWHNSIEEAAHG